MTSLLPHDKFVSKLIDNIAIANFMEKQLAKEATLLMNLEVTEQKKKRIREYRTFLNTLSKTSEDYLFLMTLQDRQIWFFGNLEERFELGVRQSEDAYLVEQWDKCIHPKDLSRLIADMDGIFSGEKDSHNLNYRVCEKDGKYVWINCQGTVKKDENGEPFLMVGRISETFLRHRIDPLTGLFNREQMKEDLGRALRKNKKGVFLLFGIDNMKSINTIRGRMAGDSFLQLLAEVLEEEAPTPRIYRVSGDTFAVFNQGSSPEDAKTFFSKIRLRTKRNFTISCGAVSLDLPIKNVGWLEQYSEFSLRKAKEAGKDTLYMFDAEDYQAEEISVALLNELIESVKSGCKGFSLVYQPQVKAGTYNLFGAEALLRYDSPSKGRVYPDEFIPILERFDLMYLVGSWVLNRALIQCKKWRKYVPNFHVSVNVSFSQLLKPGIRQLVLSILAQSGLPGSALTLEVTESMQLQDFQHYNDVFESWKEKGIEISVDDFGTGYSSLGYLSQLNVNEIKVDRCFINGINTNSYNYLLIKNIVDLAEDSQIRVCCEGVEQTGELQILEEMHVDLLQGYLFSKPCEPEVFERQFFVPEAPEYHQHLKKVADMEEIRIASYLNMQHSEILRSLNMGLWMLRSADNGRLVELYTDETMRRILGLKQQINPDDCFRYLIEHVRPDLQSYVINSMDHAMKTGRVTRMQYFWEHPEKGEVEVCSTCARAEAFKGEFCLHGYHRIISDIDDLARGNQDSI